MIKIVDENDAYFGKYLKPIKFHILKSEKTFVKIDGHDKIAQLSISFSKVFDVVEIDGSNVVNLKDNSPISRYVPKFDMEMITKKQYEELLV